MILLALVSKYIKFCFYFSEKMDGDAPPEEDFNPLREVDNLPEQKSRKLRISKDGESEKPGRLQAWYSSEKEW